MSVLLTTAEMAEADRLTIAAGTPGRALMDRAGEAVAATAIRIHRGGIGTRVLVLCGPGNNGGDGYVVARVLRDAGYDVRVEALGDPVALRGDAANAYEAWAGPVGRLSAAPIEADLVVDALFGAGLARDLDGEAQAAVKTINAWRQNTGASVLAIDVPSGVDGNSGAVRGVAVQADHTVTFFRRKPGHLLLPGRLHCGAIEVADIGIADGVLASIGPAAWVNEPSLWRAALPVPTHAGHKYSRGHAVVVSGGPETTGAARLAARGALRGGAGLVTVATPADALGINAAGLTAIMVRVADGPDGLAHLLEDARKNAVVVGPGLGVGEETRIRVLRTLQPAEKTRHVVLDADALTSFADQPETLFAAIGRSDGSVVLTPHTGEYARLFGAVPGSKLEQARAAARRSGATVVLKGADTCVAHPDGRVAIACNAPPWLGTAGAGDVLAGLIGGLLAAGMPSWEAACAAVWMHGATAARFGGPGMIAEDLPDLLPAVWRDLVAPAGS